MTGDPHVALLWRKNLESRFLLWEPLLTPAPTVCFVSFLSTQKNTIHNSGRCAGSWDRRPNSGLWTLSRDGTPLSKEAGSCVQPSASSCGACKPNTEEQSSTVKTA